MGGEEEKEKLERSNIERRGRQRGAGEVASPTPGSVHQELGAPTECLDVFQYPRVHEDLVPSWYLAGSQFILAQKSRIVLTIFS